MLAAFLLLIGCAEDPGLLERIDRLEAELEKRDSTISALEKQIRSKQAAEQKNQPLELSRIEESFAGQAMQLRSELTNKLGADNVLTYSLSRVERMDTTKPYSASIKIAVQIPNQGTASLTADARGNTSGEWQLPTADNILLQANQLATQQQQQPTTRQPKDTRGSQQTVEIEWGGNNQQRQPQQPPVPNVDQKSPPRKTTTPDPVLPVDRDVIIDFGD